MECVLITGASRRLGAEISKELACSGAFVWIHYRSVLEKAEALRNEIVKSGGKADCIAADLLDIDQIDAMLDTIQRSDNGDLTTLINNASLMLKGTLKDTSPDVWDRLMNTNLKAVWYLSSKFADRFSSAARIITIGDASVSGLYSEHAVYGLSKYALKFLTKQMAVAYAPEIRVNLLSPGLVMRGENEPEEVWKKRLERSLLDNGQIIGSIINGIRFLMKDPGMTGSEILIDNGLHLHSKMKL